MKPLDAFLEEYPTPYAVIGEFSECDYSVGAQIALLLQLADVLVAPRDYCGGRDAGGTYWLFALPEDASRFAEVLSAVERPAPANRRSLHVFQFDTQTGDRICDIVERSQTL